MVGGLVQQQQIGPLPDQHGQHQTGFFATRQRTHGLRDHGTSESKFAKKIAQLLFTCAGAHVACQTHHVHQRSVVELQHIEFLLGKVANRQTLAFGHHAAEGCKRLCDGLDQGRFALAIGAQDANALARQHRAADVAHDGGAAVAAHQLVKTQHGVGQAQRLAKLKTEVAGREHRRELFHACQCLDSALRLFGF